MNKLRFKVISRDKSSSARAGEIKTAHGIIRTPAFIPVGSTASVKSLTPPEIKECNIDAFFVNTYHMLFRPGTSVINKIGGLHKFMNWDGPIMTDSGGFQAFSLGEYGPRQNSDQPQKLVRITEEGIYFKSIWDGQTVFLGPKESIQVQQTLASDIMMSFDECTFYPITKSYAQKAMERTHLWAEICLSQAKTKPEQALYGIIQGSIFEDLRKQSAVFMRDMPFDGYAIGSVANSQEPRKLVFSVLDWTLPELLTTEKPIHFLGIGEIEDILLSVEKGIDSLDCITPTRLGRMGWIFDQSAGIKNKFRFDLTKSSFSADKNSPVSECHCYTCRNFSRAYLNHLFRSKELLAYRLATIHNLYFFGEFMEKIRNAIADSQFLRLKKEWLKY